MGRKYYCDYCDKRIQNDYNIIKQHNVGLPHLRAKAEYFQQFKSMFVQIMRVTIVFNIFYSSARY